MWTGQSSWQTDQEPMGEINVTPLVDVMLVLLVIFMVTAPLLTQGIDVELPKADAPDLTQNVEPLVVSIRADGTIFLQRHRIPRTLLVTKIRAVRRTRPDLPLYVRGDGRTPYAEVARVMALLAQAGIDKVGLVTEPESR
ncbi:MAG: protein TolR [Zetaproteobacteria bacterium]|nr:MAG: protein TolR [Zetaproteobacteria bacterium]